MLRFSTITTQNLVVTNTASTRYNDLKFQTYSMLDICFVTMEGKRGSSYLVLDGYYLDVASRTTGLNQYTIEGMLDNDGTYIDILTFLLRNMPKDRFTCTRPVQLLQIDYQDFAGRAQSLYYQFDFTSQLPGDPKRLSSKEAESLKASFVESFKAGYFVTIDLLTDDLKDRLTGFDYRLFLRAYFDGLPSKDLLKAERSRWGIKINKT